MALEITQLCICCDACLPACPHKAIKEGEEIYEINDKKCDECQRLSAPLCVSVCPVKAIVKKGS